MDVATAEATTLFSLDGIHPNNVGYAVLAEAFLDEIADLTGETFAPVADQVWHSTYGLPGTPDPTKAMPASMDPGIDGAMSRLFR